MFFGISAQNDAEWWSSCRNWIDFCIRRANWAVLTASTPPPSPPPWFERTVGQRVPKYVPRIQKLRKIQKSINLRQ